MDHQIHEPLDPRRRNPFSIWLVVADIYNETEPINWLVDVALILWLAHLLVLSTLGGLLLTLPG